VFHSPLSQPLSCRIGLTNEHITMLTAMLLMSLVRLEQDSSAESQEAIRNLVLMVASLTMCGYKQLRPSQASTGSLFQMLGFALPEPSGRGELC
jgi:hypothetical protein